MLRVPAISWAVNTSDCRTRHVIEAEPHNSSSKSLDKFKVGEREKSELLAALGGMKGDIVQ